MTFSTFFASYVGSYFPLEKEKTFLNSAECTVAFKAIFPFVVFASFLFLRAYYLGRKCRSILRCFAPFFFSVFCEQS